ncbi:MAG: hypothetical protein GX282_05465 [Campylobacteraceae bacterium]|nr:hypothetical protein [Campylobacteraceae bacterium]
MRLFLLFSLLATISFAAVSLTCVDDNVSKDKNLSKTCEIESLPPFLLELLQDNNKSQKSGSTIKQDFNKVSPINKIDKSGL